MSLGKLCLQRKYVCLTTTTLSRQLTMHLNDSSSITLDLKTHSIPKSKYWKILFENTTIKAFTIHKFSSEGTINSITKPFFNLTDQMTISGRWAVYAISVGNTKWCSKSVATCQSVQSSSNDDLCLFLHKSFEIFPSLMKGITLLVILFRDLLAVSQHIFATSAKISRTLLCLHV